MSCSLAVYITVFIAFNLGVHSYDSRTYLASKPEETKAKTQGSLQRSRPTEWWQEVFPQGEAGVAGATTASHLEHQGSSTAPQVYRNDLVLCPMSEGKSRSGRVLQKMSDTLVGEALERQEEEESQQEQKPKQEVGGWAELHSGCRSRSGRSGRLVHVCNQCPVDPDDPAEQTVESAGACRQGVDEPEFGATTTTSFASSTSGKGKSAIDRRGNAVDEDDKGAQRSGSGDIGQSASQVGRVVRAQCCDSADKRARTQPFEQAESPEVSGRGHPEAHHCHGPRMGKDGSGSDEESGPSCSVVPVMSQRIGCQARCEDEGNPDCHCGDEESLRFFTQQCGRFAGASGHNQHGVSVPRSAQHHCGSWENGGLDRRCGAHHRRRDGGRIGNGHRGQRSEQAICEEGNVQWSKIAYQSRQQPPEAEGGEAIDFGWNDQGTPDGQMHFPRVLPEGGFCTSVDHLCSLDENVDGRFNADYEYCEDSFCASMQGLYDLSRHSVFDSLNKIESWGMQLTAHPDSCSELRELRQDVKSVRFHDDVQIRICTGELSCTYLISSDHAQTCFRKCWSLYNSTTSMNRIRYVMQSEGATELPQSASTGVHSPRSVGASRQHNQPISQQSSFPDAWTSIADAVTSSGRFNHVETWYVCEHRHEVCHHSRVVVVTPGMSCTEFERKCRDAWADLVDNGAIHWHVVQDPPTGRYFTKAHLILAQGDETRQAHLVHWDRWPILAKFRAVSVGQTVRTHELLSHAGAILPRNDQEARYAAFYREGGRTEYLDENDVVQIETPTVLYGYVEHVQHSDDESSQGNVSTSAGTESEGRDMVNDVDDEVSWMTAGSIIHNFDQTGPYPWELDSPMDEVAEDMEEVDLQLQFSYEDRYQMEHHAEFLRALEPRTEQNWVAVTFGVGLAPLGRRDVEFNIDELDYLADRIKELWSDHVQRGDAALHFVTPQPERLHNRKYLVFLVAIDYGDHEALETKKILVREVSLDPTVVDTQPYGASIYDNMTPRSVTAQLGHHECFPLGIRDCSVKMAGRWLRNDIVIQVPNGALCDVHIGLYPEYVQEAQRTVVNAENMFQIARAHFESESGSPTLVLRVHGISPRNNPLGFRDIPIDYPDFTTLRWIMQMRSLWPFRDDHVRCWFVPRGNLLPMDEIDAPILHVILSYAENIDGCPVLVKQRIHSVAENSDHVEMHAIVIDSSGNLDTTWEQFQRPPFWFHSQARTHIYRDGRSIGNDEDEWRAGDVVDLNINVHRQEHMLIALLEMTGRSQIEYEQEDISLLQRSVSIGPDEIQDCKVQNQLSTQKGSHIDAFAEICLACLHQVETEEDNHCHVGASSADVLEEAAKPEDNSDLRCAESIKKQTTDCKPIQISLEHTLILDDVPFSQDRQLFQWFQCDNWEDRIQTAWSHPLSWLPEGLHIHPNTWEALHHQVWCEDDETCTWELYIDGSMSQGKGGWSVVVVCANTCGRCLKGMMAGEVVTDQSDSRWIGVERVTSITSELTALLIAQAFAASLPSHYDVVIRPDLRLSRELTELKVTLKTNETLSSMSTCLSRVAGSRARVEEVRAHKGDPWNELADGLAKYVVEHEQNVGQVHWEVLHTLALEQFERDWLWLQNAPIAMQQSFPPMFDKQVVQIPGPSTQCPITPAQVQPEEYDSKLEVRCCSVNVLALDESESQSGGQRALRLDHQMHQRGISCLGLQETRTLQGQRLTDHYAVFSSGGAGKGGCQFLGCELWLHRFQDIVTCDSGQKFKFKDFQVITTHADERRLILQLSGPTSIVIASLHAPCLSTNNDLEQVEHWWKETAEHLSKCSGKMTVICCDANAPLASHETGHFGMHDAEDMNPQGYMFQEFLETQDYVAPSTFQGHLGPSGTWKHPRGKLLRRDYIVVSSNLFPAARESQVLADVDLGFSHPDHYPVMRRFACAIKTEKQKQKFRWDKRKFKDENICAQFQAELAAVPIPRWSVDIDTHNEYFNQNVLAIAQKHFGCTTGPSKFRPQLQEATLNLMAFKRQVLRIMKGATGASLVDVKSQLKEIEKQLRKMVQRDQRSWYEQWITDLDLAANAHNSATVYKMLQRLGRRKKSDAKGPRPLPLLQISSSEYAQSYEQMQSVWCHQFAKNEAGISIDENNLADLHLAEPILHEDQIDMKMMPSLHQVSKIIGSLKNGRVPGPNGILGEILKAGGPVLATQLLPILSKATLWAHEPLQWKGGCLIPLLKGQNCPSKPESYRSIFLSDSTAKIHHRWVRGFLEQAWLDNTQSLQLGGRKGMGTDITHHIVQSAAAWTKSKGMSMAILFLDLRAAFYSVFRASIFAGQTDDRLLCLAMESFGILPEEWHEFRQTLEQDHAIEGTPAHAEKILQDMFQGTHFRMAKVSQPVLSTRGTRPGDPVGDIMFNMVFSIILRQSREQFLQQVPFQWIAQPTLPDNLHSLPPLPEKGFMDIAYVDDAAFTMFAPCAQDVLQAAQLMASIIHDVAKIRGLDVNYRKGKTELFLKLSGKGSRATKQKVWHEWNAQVPVVTERGCQKLHVVRTYKHLGTVMQENGTPVREIAQRITAAKKAEGRIHRSFYSKRIVSVKTKQQVFHATAESRHAYNAHVWSWVGDKELAKWEDGMRETVSHVCKGSTKRVPAFKLKTKSLYALANMLPPTDQLHVTRLKYCRRIIHRAPVVLWQFVLEVQDVRGWGALLVESVKWLRKFGPRSCASLPDDIFGILTMIAIDDTFTRKVAAAQKSCFQYRRQNALSQVRQQDIAITLSRCGLHIDEIPEAQPKWQCIECGQEFGNRRGLSLHSVWMHGYRKKAKYWMDGCDCLVCGKRYFTHTRAVTHLQSSPHCLAVYQACFPPLDEATADQNDEEDRLLHAALKEQGWLPTKALTPVMRIAHAALPPVGSPEAKQMLDKWQARRNPSEVRFQRMAGRMVEQGEMHCKAASTNDDGIIAFCGNSPGGRDEGHLGIFRSDGLPRMYAQVTIRSRIFLHMFSGFRRRQDLQEQLEAMRVDGEMIHCVSIDICLAREHCNLLEGSTLGFWKTKMRDGWIVGLGGGPPCETFTAARLEPGGPPPLRSFDEPHGLPSLTAKQWQQVATGTALVYALVELLVEAARLGLMGFLEHPSFPTWQMRRRPASIWCWPVISWLARMPCCQITTTDQCLYGCQGRKPTTFLTIRMEAFRQKVMSRGRQGRCNHPQGHPQLIGKDQSGRYRTEHAKVYPAALNSDIALAAVEYMKVATSGSYIHLPKFVAELRCHDFTAQDVVQRDFHG